MSSDRIFCTLPSSVIVKSSFFRSRTKLPFPSRTWTFTNTTSVLVLSVSLLSSLCVTSCDTAGEASRKHKYRETQRHREKPQQNTLNADFLCAFVSLCLCASILYTPLESV